MLECIGCAKTFVAVEGQELPLCVTCVSREARAIGRGQPMIDRVALSCAVRDARETTGKLLDANIFGCPAERRLELLRQLSQSLALAAAAYGSAR